MAKKTKIFDTYNYFHTKFKSIHSGELMFTQNELQQLRTFLNFAVRSILKVLSN